MTSALLPAVIGTVCTLAKDLERCSSNTLAAGEESCFVEFKLSDVFVDGIPVPLAFSRRRKNMENLCSNLSDITACLDKAMGNCENLYFDSEAYSSTLWYICSLDSYQLLLAELLCPVDEKLVNCTELYKKEVENLKYHLYMNKTDPPLKDICEVFQKTRTCLHIKESGNCTHKYAHILSTLYKGRFTPSVCSQFGQLSSLSHVPIVNILNLVFTFSILWNLL